MRHEHYGRALPMPKRCRFALSGVGQWCAGRWQVRDGDFVLLKAVGTYESCHKSTNAVHTACRDKKVAGQDWWLAGGLQDTDKMAAAKGRANAAKFKVHLERVKLGDWAAATQVLRLELVGGDRAHEARARGGGGVDMSGAVLCTVVVTLTRNSLCTDVALITAT